MRFGMSIFLTQHYDDLLGDKRDPVVDGVVVTFFIDKIREVAYPLTLHITIDADNEQY